MLNENKETKQDIKSNYIFNQLKELGYGDLSISGNGITERSRFRPDAKKFPEEYNYFKNNKLYFFIDRSAFDPGIYLNNIPIEKVKNSSIDNFIKYTVKNSSKIESLIKNYMHTNQMNDRPDGVTDFYRGSSNQNNEMNFNRYKSLHKEYARNKLNYARDMGIKEDYFNY